MKIEEIARICHQVNKSFCESIGDNSQINWEESQEWQKKSAINGVKFHLENQNIMPSDSHDSWLKEKIENGWIYGEVKNIEKKTHPCCVPYEQLPIEQKSKDYIFKAIVDCFK